mgnify:CR=1 FL=1
MKADYEYIYTIYQEGSFTRAAERLFITQPALSIAIRKIEARIGMPLFVRNRRPVQLTPAGQLYLKAIRKMQHLENDLDREVLEYSPSEGILSFRKKLVEYYHKFNIDLLAAFAETYPRIHLKLVEEGSDDLLSLLEKEELDLTFSCDPTTIRRHSHHYRAFQDQILLAVPRALTLPGSAVSVALTCQDVLEGRASHPDCPSVPLSLFRDLPFILLTPGNNLHQRCQILFREAGFTPHVKLMLSQLATAYRLAEHGLAATFVSDAMVSRDSETLLFFRLSDRECIRTFHALLPDREFTPYAVRALIQLLGK